MAGEFVVADIGEMHGIAGFQKVMPARPVVPDVDEIVLGRKVLHAPTDELGKAAGIAEIGECLPLTIPKAYAPADEVDAFSDAVLRMAHERSVGLVVVAPDDPLALGLADRVEAAGIAAFGPSKAAAQIEASKSFAKDLMRRHGIPMGENARFDDVRAAARYIESRPGNVVVKADGLSAGKGAIVTDSHERAVAVTRRLLYMRR